MPLKREGALALYNFDYNYIYFCLAFFFVFFLIFSLPFYVFPFRGEGKEDTGIGEFLNNLHVSCFTLLALIKHNNNNRGRLSYNNNNIRVCINTKYNGELLHGFFASFFTLLVPI